MIPDGLPTSFRELTSGGDVQHKWISCPPFKGYTNAFIWDPVAGKMLLGLKRRGFGEGKFNGFGGKIEGDETPLEAAKRELLEECCINAPLKPCGILLFVTEDASFAHYIHVFSATEWEGVPQETDEMTPYWFSIPSSQSTSSQVDSDSLPPIPFPQMWEDDLIWFPYMLSGTYFVGRADFTKTILENEGNKEVWEMKRWWFGERVGE